MTTYVQTCSVSANYMVQLTNSARVGNVAVVHARKELEVRWGESARLGRAQNITNRPNETAKQRFLLLTNNNSRIVLRHADVDVKHAALIRASHRTGDRCAPLVNV